MRYKGPFPGMRSPIVNDRSPQVLGDTTWWQPMTLIEDLQKVHNTCKWQQSRKFRIICPKHTLEHAFATRKYLIILKENMVLSNCFCDRSNL